MSECYCDYDPAEFYHSEKRKARKPHKCDECGGTIHSGERYEHVRAKWDGDVASHDTCARCLNLREFVEAHVPCVCWNHGNMIEQCIDAAMEWAHETTGLRFGAYRRKVLIDRAAKIDSAIKGKQG